MTALLVLVCVALCVGLITCLLSLWRLQAAMSVRVEEEVDLALREFKKRSGRTRVGTTVEQMVPFVKHMPFDPSDMRILSGGPVDYVVFDGLCDGEVRELVFLDIKTGKGKANSAQKQVKRCADLGRVRFGIFEVDEWGGVRYKPSDRIEGAVDLTDTEADRPSLEIVTD